MEIEYSHVALNLLIVLALMCGLLFLLKKLKSAKYAGNKEIKVVNMISIGSKEKLILVEVNKTHLLLGATPNHIETLYSFNDAEKEPILSGGKEFSEHLQEVSINNT